MKKAVFFTVLFLTFLMVCNAQSVNYERAIVGTWVDNAGNTWIFNANGTVTVDGENGKYGISGGKLAIQFTGDSLFVLEISISSDGKTLIGNGFGGNFLWLTKR